MDRLDGIHPSDGEIEQYHKGMVNDRREFVAIGIHVSECPYCLDRVEQIEPLMRAVRAGVGLCDK